MWRIENHALEERYKIMRTKLRAESGTEDFEQEFFHGTPYVEEICETGFNANYSNKNNFFGKGWFLTVRSYLGQLLCVPNI